MQNINIRMKPNNLCPFSCSKARIVFNYRLFSSSKYLNDSLKYTRELKFRFSNDLESAHAKLHRQRNICLFGSLKSKVFLDNHIRRFEYKVFEYIVRFLNVFEDSFRFFKSLKSARHLFRLRNLVMCACNYACICMHTVYFYLLTCE